MFEEAFYKDMYTSFTCCLNLHEKNTWQPSHPSSAGIIQEELHHWIFFVTFKKYLELHNATLKNLDSTFNRLFDTLLKQYDFT